MPRQSEQFFPYKDNANPYSQLRKMPDNNTGYERMSLREVRKKESAKVASRNFRARRREERSSEKQEIGKLRERLAKLEQDVIDMAINDSNKSLDDDEKETFFSLQEKMDKEGEMDNADVARLNDLRSKLGSKQLYPLKKVSDDRFHKLPLTYPNQGEQRIGTSLSSIMNTDNESGDAGYAGTSQSQEPRLNRPHTLPQVSHDRSNQLQLTYRNQGEQRSGTSLSSIMNTYDESGDAGYGGELRLNRPHTLPQVTYQNKVHERIGTSLSSIMNKDDESGDAGYAGTSQQTETIFSYDESVIHPSLRY